MPGTGKSAVKMVYEEAKEPIREWFDTDEEFQKEHAAWVAEQAEAKAMEAASEKGPVGMGPGGEPTVTAEHPTWEA